jgi:hypothetical protein
MKATLRNPFAPTGRHATLMAPTIRERERSRERGRSVPDGHSWGSERRDRQRTSGLRGLTRVAEAPRIAESAHI